jgi:hypothetical protein
MLLACQIQAGQTKHKQKLQVRTRLQMGSDYLAAFSSLR